MSVRNLEHLLKPTSVALIGASTQSGSVGAVVARNLFRSGYSGPVMPVNPRHQAVEGVLAYPDVASLPLTPDLALIATPPPTVPGLVAELGARGTKAAVVITAGLNQATAGGASLRQKMLEAARPHLLRILGPNCLGVMVPGIGLNGSFAHLSPPAGGLAFVTQSGAMATAVLDWATARGIGFSHFVSLGDMADVDFGDLLDYLAADPGTHAVLLYIEAVTHTRKFMSAARACARLKPLIVIKAGRHAAGARAAASHTGALAGTDAVYDAALRRAGALRVYQTHELFDAVETLGMAPQVSGDRLAILTNGGGPGVLAIDALIDAGGKPAELSAETIARLDAVLPAAWSHGNPIDIIGDAPGSRFASALKILLDDQGCSAILVLNAPTAIASGSDAARAVIEAVGLSRRPVLTSWLGNPAAAESRRLFAAHRIPTYSTPEQAVRGFMHIVHYRRNQELLLQAPPSLPETFAPDTASAGILIRNALSEGLAWLPDAQAKALLASYGIPVVPTHTARTPAEAARAAAAFNSPVALKILSPDITHKSDLSGVVLDLRTPQAVQEAAAAMLQRIGDRRPGAKLDGFTVQPMVQRPGAYELILGMTEDSQFGPVLLFGHGGTAVEVINDKALALPPLNMALAHELIAGTRIARLLRGFRGKPAVALDNVALTLVKVSQLITDWAEIAELDINPLLADAGGVVALDARVRLARMTQCGAERLAIRPYPRELEQNLTIRDGTQIFVRPIRPEDGSAVQTLFSKLRPEDIRLRFFAPMRILPTSLAARLTQIDYDREMALAALEDPLSPNGILAMAHIACDPDNELAEFAVLVRSDMKGRGLGYGLMSCIIDHARRRGVHKIFGEILRENQVMLKMCGELGFTVQSEGDEYNVLRATLNL
ncbi:MAG TPA: bifunctional acetate--CoA ligase family protein/GNAT family N-acetyltransferase [Roseomonas sp.]|nr:bifunctional acetate--CoA ligase family protein/GNAT family N-acetyltransferase [Roseomonas sp.]